MTSVPPSDLEAEGLAAVASADSPEALEEIRVRYLGRKGALKGLLGGIGQLPAEDRPKVGALANPVRGAIEEALAERRVGLEAEALDARLLAEAEDVTLPGRPVWRGSLHPLRETEREIARIFGQFGFVVVDGPEVESDERGRYVLGGLGPGRWRIEAQAPWGVETGRDLDISESGERLELGQMLGAKCVALPRRCPRRRQTRRPA